MKKPNIAKILKTHILTIENTLALTRIHASRSEGKSYFAYDSYFSKKPVKASSRYIYDLEEFAKGFSLSFGFYFLDNEKWKEGVSLPLEEQTVTVSYAFSTPNEDAIFCGNLNKSDHFDKEITSSEKMCVNTAKTKFKEFKNQLIIIKELNKNITKNDIIEIFDDIFTYVNTHTKVNYPKIISSELECYSEIIDEARNNYYLSSKKLKDANKSLEKQLAESKEQKHYDKLQNELRLAKAELLSKKNDIYKELDISSLYKINIASSKKWEETARTVLIFGQQILKKIAAPMRFKDEVKKAVEIDKNKII